MLLYKKKANSKDLQAKILSDENVYIIIADEAESFPERT